MNHQTNQINNKIYEIYQKKIYINKWKKKFNKNWKLYIIKETLIFVFEMLKFFFISVPLACCVYFTAHLYFEIKRLYNGKNS
jgi:hypothetical protein